MLYDNIVSRIPDSRKKRHLLPSGDNSDFLTKLAHIQEEESTEQQKTKRAVPIDDVHDISNALEEMMDTNYLPKNHERSTEECPVNDLMTPIADISKTEAPIQTLEIKNGGDFSDILDIEKTLDSTLPPIIETTMSSYLLTEIPQISRKPYEVVTTLEQLLASAPEETHYIAPTVDSKEVFEEDLSADEETTAVSRRRIETTTEMLKICKKKEEIRPTQQTTVTKHHRGKTTDWNQVIYPLEIETMEPEEEEEEKTPCDEPHTTECATEPTTIEDCPITSRGRIIPEEKNENETEYYVDIVVPYDTGEQQHYIDRLVKRESPSDYDFLDYPNRVQRASDDRQIWSEFNWPEHKKYDSLKTLTTTPREIEVLGEETTESVPLEKSSLDESEDREIWKEFKWPEHKKYGTSTEGSSTQNQLEVHIEGDDQQIWKEFESPTHDNFDSSASSTVKRGIEVLLGEDLKSDKSETLDDRQIWREFKWPEHKKYGDKSQDSLVTTEKYIEALSDETKTKIDKSDTETKYKDGEEGRQIWKEFNWPEQREPKISVIESLTSTEKNIEDLVKDESILTKFKWPEHKEYGSSTTRGQTQMTNSWREQHVQSSSRGNSGNIWNQFNWPEHRKYGSTSVSTTAHSTVSHSHEGNKNIWNQFNWPQHKTYGDSSSTARWQGFPVPGTELPQKNSFEDYESELGIAEKTSFGESSEFPARPKVPAKLTGHVNTETSSEWNEFNFPSDKNSASERYEGELASFPSKEKLTRSTDMPLNVVPMDEYEALDALEKSQGVTFSELKDKGEELDSFDWSEKNTLSTSERGTTGPHVMKTGLWEELHLPLHESHMKVIPVSNVESTTNKRLERTTTDNEGLWNKFQWPEHKKYSSTKPATSTVPSTETSLRINETTHSTVIVGSTEKNELEETGIAHKFNWPIHKYYTGVTTSERPSNNSNPPEETKDGGKVFDDLIAISTQLSLDMIETTPMKIENQGTESVDDYLEGLFNEKEHTTKIIESTFSPQELTSKTYILDGTEKKTTTDIWEAFRWPSPRTQAHEDTSEERWQKATPESMPFPSKNIENTTAVPSIEDQLDKPEVSLDLFAFPPLESETKRSNYSLLDIPVPPFPLPEEYEEYSMLSSTETWSDHDKFGDTELLSEIKLPYPDEIPSEKLDFADEYKSSESVASFYPLSEFTSEHNQEKPFWNHEKKKGHHHKTSTSTEGFPTKHTSPPTKSTTVGEFQRKL